MADLKFTRQELISLCRLCLAKDLASIDIFETGSEVRQLFTKIVACLPIHITTGDSLPHKICEVCNSKVDDFYQFWTRTAQNQKQLNEWFQLCTDDDQKTIVPTIKVEADDTRQDEEYDDYDDGGQGDDSDDDEDAPSAAKRIKTQDSGDEDQKPTDLDAILENSTDVNGQKDGSSKKKAKEKQFDNGLVGVVTQEEWEILCLSKCRTCPKCNRSYSCARTMRRHLTSVHALTKSYPCNECDKMFSTKDGASVHMKSIHRGEPVVYTPLECDYCGAIKKNKTLLRDHICAHMGLKLHSCSSCKTSFHSNKALKRHCMRHEKRPYGMPVEDYQIEGISTEQYKKLVKNKVTTCPICNKGYTSPRNMRKHLREVHAIQKSRICDQCGNQYKSKSSLREHKKHMHSTDKKDQARKEKKFECHICGVLQSTKYTLRDHINTHTGTKYECDICGNGYASVKHLRRHKVKHLQETGQLPASMTHQCKLCMKVFTQAHRLKKHLEWVHGDKHHLCKICGAEIKGSLDQHMITHTGEKKYCCHICGKKLRGKLKEHMLTHTGERPYACEFCGSTFKDKWYLRIHVRKHSGERPYMCNHCGQSFAARSAFTLHLKKHSNLSQNVQCEYCRLSFPTKLKLKEHLKTHFS